MNRRNAFAAVGVAAASLAAGAGWGWRRGHGSDTPARDASSDVWASSFSTLEGKPLALSSLRGRPLLLNFWATWCAPCVIEMPLLDAFSSDATASGWRVLALAVDREDSVRRFLANRALRLPVALAGAEGIDLSRRLGNLQGALPFTAIFGSGGALLTQKLGAVDADRLLRWRREIR